MSYNEEKIKDDIIEILLDQSESHEELSMEDIYNALPDSDDYDQEFIFELISSLRKQGVEIMDEEGDIIAEEADQTPITDMDPYAGISHISSDDTISLYLREMSRVPLLSSDEERSLAIRIEQGDEAKIALSQLDGNATVQQKAELENLIESGQEARDHLIKANTRLVVSIAKRYTNRGVPFLDLIQEGNLGLMKAVEKFDYTKGFRFSTYATWWIRQTITRAIADQGRTIRVPVHMVDRIRLMYKRIHELEQTLGRNPTIDELADSMDIDKQKVSWMLRVSWLPLSLESPINDDEDESELGHFVEDKETPTPIQTVYSKLLKEKIDTVLDTLPCREARILKLRFGLEDGKFYTLEEVGKKFGLTRERIRQLETKALRRLRQPQKSQQLRDYR
ncbi:MAG: RNA polymerase sigma factor [Anaerolinea thermophila]|uniref:RNA polymerase sigma factor n=1 Tax=Anaerolinea thermophila TaxID=167964 RepID=A0A101FYN2_9CHLR|nr:MAG: RNA polymerase sigma factor [Anaerolinea thermophila]